MAGRWYLVFVASFIFFSNFISKRVARTFMKRIIIFVLFLFMIPHLSWASLWKKSNPDWRAVSYYRQKNYKSAIQELKHPKTTLSYYNLGNALAFSHQYQAAIAAYTKALELDPNNKDAKYNRELLKKLLKQSQRQKRKRKRKQNQQKKQSKNNPKKQNKTSESKHKKSKPKKQSKTDIKTRRWLERVPDDPGGLLRQKFIRDHYRMLNQKRKHW